MPSLFDSHCHPQFAAYDADREIVIRRAIDQGVFMIAVGTSYETSRAAVNLAKKYPGRIWATVGIHPGHASKGQHDPLETKKEIAEEKLDDRFYELAKLQETVGIGETGLDYHYLNPVPGDNGISRIQLAQKELFLEHIKLAAEVKKPLMIHARDAYRDVFEILSDASFRHGIVMHFFQGTPEQARWFLDLGAYISFAGPITFTEQYDEVLQSVPVDRILIETDAPYASPAPFRGRRNEPSYVRFVAEKIAKIHGKPTEDIAKMTTQNITNVFHGIMT